MYSLMMTIDNATLLTMIGLCALLTTCCGIVLSGRCPMCSWFEWVSPASGEDEAD